MILNINKPKGITSHDVVDAIRKIMGERRVGHAGTLDSFATGVLVVGVGRESTKKLGDINENSQKEYEALVEFGKISNTADSTGIIQEVPRLPSNPLKMNRTGQASDRKNLKENEVREALHRFTGEITQTPPVFSAVRVQGTRAYKLAAKGKQVTMPPRHITIYELELLEYTFPFIKIRVVCSAGTYIRTLVEDIGKALGTGAYTKEQIRTRVGKYKIEESKILKDLAK